MTTSRPRSDALESLYWRGEILQAMFWMRGERLAASVDPLELAMFLAAEPATVHRHLRRLAEEGYVSVAEGTFARYELTDVGAREGGRGFADEFEGLTKSGHGECGPDCWCQDPKHAADACNGRPEHVHGA